jgi:hypothetical protein
VSKEFHQPVPGNPDARRFQVCSSSARRKDQGPLRTTDRGFRVEIYDVDTAAEALERFHRSYEVADMPRVQEIDFG